MYMKDTVYALGSRNITSNNNVDSHPFVNGGKTTGLRRSPPQDYKVSTSGLGQGLSPRAAAVSAI